MVNVSAVDEFSTPTFPFKKVVSNLYKSNRFEVDVRTEIAGKKWDCSISAPSKGLAELALASCATLAK